MKLFGTIDTLLMYVQMGRERIFEIIEVDSSDDPVSASYDKLMILCTIGSVFPLFFKAGNELFDSIESTTVSLFVVDYILRWLTADIKRPKYKLGAFLRYPFTFFALVDLLSILPWLIQGQHTLRLFRIFRAFKALRLMRYFTGFRIIARAIRKERKALEAVLLMAVMYIVISALVMFSAEPDNFDTFFNALYWAVVTLTTVGYGDVYPMTDFGRIISMISAFVGIAIVALPTGIITAGFMSELQSHYSDDDEEEN